MKPFDLVSLHHPKPRNKHYYSKIPRTRSSGKSLKKNQFPYLEVRKPFILGTREETWKATIAHRFAELLHTKTNKLTRVYTQNIDGWIASARRFHQNESLPSTARLLRFDARTATTRQTLIILRCRPIQYQGSLQARSAGTRNVNAHSLHQMPASIGETSNRSVWSQLTIRIL